MNRLNTYQKEQLDALHQVQNALMQMDTKTKNRLLVDFKSYLDFREEVDRYLDEHLSSYCAQACFKSQTSACCSKDGIITFWADMVINACCCTNDELNMLISAVKQPQHPQKCVYLSSEGCLWTVRPLVCAMFVCDQLQADVINQDPNLSRVWERYRRQAKGFRWPDKPVLFDRLEEMFMDLGCQSPLMYINYSPALVQIKRKAQSLQDAVSNCNVYRNSVVQRQSTSLGRNSTVK